MNTPEFQQETANYSQLNQYIEQQKEYYNDLIAQGGQTLGEGTPLFVDTFRNIKNVYTHGKDFLSKASTIKEDTEQAIKKASEKIMKTGEESLKKIHSTIGEGAQKISQKVEEGAKDIYKSSLEGLDLQKTKILQSIRARNLSLQEKMKNPELNTEDLERYTKEIKTNLNKAGEILNKSPEEAMKNFTDKNFLESLHNKIRLESKPTFEQQQGYMRNFLDKKLELKTQKRMTQEFERDPEDIDSRVSIITARDKAIESTKQAFNPLSKQYETVNKGLQQTAEKVGQEVGKVQQNIEQVGKEAMQAGKQTIKEGVEGITSTAKETAQTAIDTAKSAVSKTSNIAGEVAKTAEEVGENVAKTAGEAAESIGSTALEALGPVGELVGTGMLLYQGIKDIFEGEHHAPVPQIAAPIFTPNI